MSNVVPIRPMTSVRFLEIVKLVQSRRISTERSWSTEDIWQLYLALYP